MLDPEPEQPEPRIHRVTIEHRHVHHRSASPQRLVIIVALFVLGVICLRSPGGLLMLAVLVPSTVWLVIAVMVVVMAVAAWRAKRRGLPF